MAAMAEMIPVDGGGDQQREATCEEEDGPETQEVERAERGRKSSEKFPKFCRWIYIARPCRCDRAEQLGGTEMHYCKQLLQLGVTEMFKSVAPRLKT